MFYLDFIDLHKVRLKVYFMLKFNERKTLCSPIISVISVSPIILKYKNLVICLWKGEN